MADYQFKKGDKVMVYRFSDSFDEKNYSLGQNLTIDEDDSTNPFVLTEDGERGVIGEDSVKLITSDTEECEKCGGSGECQHESHWTSSPTNCGCGDGECEDCCGEGQVERDEYTPLTPKVGDKFRVVKDIGSVTNGYVFQANTYVEISELTGGLRLQDDTETRYVNNLSCTTNYLTTEYLEPVGEDSLTLDNISAWPIYQTGVDIGMMEPGMIFQSDDSGVMKPIKQPITTKIMNRIKKALLSKADKTLIKAGFLNQDLELSQKGEEAMQFIAFEANKKALVEMAEADIKEVEDAK